MKRPTYEVKTHGWKGQTTVAVAATKKAWNTARRAVIADIKARLEAGEGKRAVMVHEELTKDADGFGYATGVWLYDVDGGTKAGGRQVSYTIIRHDPEE